MNEIIEIARFRVKPSDEHGLLTTWPAMVEAMKRAHPALETVRLVRFKDDTWADIAVWSDRTAAEHACNLAPLPEVAEFFSYITEDVSMDIAELVSER